jgi:hypothetical protein
VLARQPTDTRVAGIDVDATDSAGLARLIDAEIRRWAGWVKDAGIQPE